MRGVWLRATMTSVLPRAHLNAFDGPPRPTVIGLSED
ncbi:hypothetical protein ACVILK_002702 [Bradyrhizobium embrapense]